MIEHLSAEKPHSDAGLRPLVSAIVIFLNGAEFIEEAIESVYSQTYPGWELLLVDDGSTDGSTEIALRHAAERPDQVRYVTHPGKDNHGMSASRNLGVAHARGRYIAFLDADDVWLPAKLEQQLAVFDQVPAVGMVYGRTLIWHGWTGLAADVHRDHLEELGVPPDTVVHPPALFCLLLANQNQPPTTCNAIMRRELVESLGGFENHFRGMYEDQVFFAKVLLHTPTYVADATWAKYRQHPASTGHRSTTTRVYYATRRPFLAWLRGYVEEQGIERDGDAWRAMNRELWAARHPYVSMLRRRARKLRARIQALLALVL
jgi:glycosyltransferase involved in cell wall biosynthesis